MSLNQIRFSGFGGQGVILMGMIVGRAATIHNNMNATLTQNFGPEARGGYCSATLLIDADPIFYPYVIQADLLVAMSQEAYKKYVPNLRENGVLIYEENLVKPVDLPKGVKSFSIPATKLAEELGRKMVANIVMTGFLAAVWKGVPEKAMRDAVMESVPKGTEKLNGMAFDKGYQYGLSVAGQSTKG
jgi:2-oxoglutarate ferredoxin oxidoreductase subunit gamma